ncbi:MAG TPA: cysteine desulfurase family protein [Candidatus Acidoferrales bacterium]|nr:cysteine desulfurase family protein [Candidatus Acidoferrales bacterium]
MQLNRQQIGGGADALSARPASRVYLDYNATTPVDPAVLEAMLPFLGANFGNAGSVHTPGQLARAAVDAARDSVAELIGAAPNEIVFTSGGTESDNLAVFGTVARSNKPRKHVITTAIEHHAILHACDELARQGVEVTVVPVRTGPGTQGIVDPEEVRRAICPETILITVMHANNELGTIQPIEEIARIAADAGVCFHCDAVQSAGKVPLDVAKLGVDLLSVSAHKFCGPKGIGALYVRAGRQISPRAWGGHAERDRRAGTENVPGIVGIGKAAELARNLLAEDSARIRSLRDQLETTLLERIPNVRLNGDRDRRVPNTSNLSFPGAGGEALLIALDLQGLACSTGAACSSGSTEPSHVLLAAGLSHDDARSSLRFSLGRPSTAADVDRAIEIIPSVVERIRALSPREQEATAVHAR